MIKHDQIGTDEDLAREIILIALDIAPCLASIPADSDDEKNALAVLKRVYKDVAGRGSRFVKAQRLGPASVDYADVRSAFAGPSTRALRSLCRGSIADAGHSRASFPADRPISRVWPETHR